MIRKTEYVYYYDNSIFYNSTVQQLQGKLSPPVIPETMSQIL